MGGSSNWSGSSMRPRTPRGTDGPAICGKFPSFFGKNYLYITTWIPTCCRNKTKMHPWKVGNFMVPSSFSSFMRLANPRKITLQTKEGWLVQAYHNPEPACPKISTHHEGHEVDVIWKINRKKADSLASSGWMFAAPSPKIKHHQFGTPKNTAWFPKDRHTPSSV